MNASTKNRDPRSAKKKAKDAAYAALPPAKVVKPLQFINNETGEYVRNERGVKVWVPSAAYEIAAEQAKLGNGVTVQRMAWAIAAGRLAA